MKNQLKISFDTLKSKSKTDFMPCIGIFGRKNCGKSSLVNLLAGDNVAEVSKSSGTTKESAKFYAALTDIGDVIIIDTSGIDDYSDAGEKRVFKTIETLKIIDFAVLLITGNLFAEPEKKLVSKFQEFSVPFIVVHNKSDLQELSSITKGQVELAYNTKMIEFSCKDNNNISELISLFRNFIPETAFESKSILGNIIGKNELVVLAIPDYINAPEGGLSRSQIEITWDLLENSCLTLFIRLSDLPAALETINPKPKLIILPTIYFKSAEEILPDNILLTSYGVVMAHYKGNFQRYLEDTPKIDLLKEKDRILIFQVSSDKTSREYKEQDELQTIINIYCGKNMEYTVVNVFDRPFINYKQYNFAIICGSFLLTKKQISSILKPLLELNIPISSFEMVNAYVRGIFMRSTELFLK